MPDPIRDTYDIEKQVYQTQWANIRHHWEQTFSGIVYLSTLISLVVVPLKFISVGEKGHMEIALDPKINCYLKGFVLILILLIGIVTFLNQYNHYARSREARKVIIAIERKWGLYDQKDRFIFQTPHTNYAYAKFAGGERRITHTFVQFSYIVVITAAATLFVYFA